MKKVVHAWMLWLTLAVAAAPAIQQPLNVAGEWVLTLTGVGGAGEGGLQLTQTGATLNGKYKIQAAELPVTGSLDGDKLKLKLTFNVSGRNAEMILDGVYAEGRLKGTIEIGGRSIGEWSAKRPTEKKPESATTAATAVNHLVHPAGTKTAPLGKLGEVVKGGRGPVDMILLPSGGFGANEFAEFMQQNAELYTMYAVTPAGFGGTPPPPIAAADDYPQRAWVKGLAQGVMQLIRERKLNKPVLVGHFLMGDYFALRLALDQPDLFSAVVLINGNPNYPLPLPKEAVTNEAQLAARLKFVREQFVPIYQTVSDEQWTQGLIAPERFCIDAQRAKSLYERAKATPKTVMIRYGLEFFTDDPRLELSKLRLPLLVIKPLADAASGLTEAQRRAQREQHPWLKHAAEMPNLSLQYVENARAFAWLDQPEAVKRVLREFVSNKSVKATPTAQSAIQIPHGNAATPDGTFNEAEWADALREKLSGGVELRFKADAEFFYVGVRGGGQGWPQLYVWDGKVMRALHASAALGTAVYSKGEGKAWKLEQGFAWELRGAKADDPARAAFLGKHGWLAKTVGMGEAGAGEFKIARRLFNEKDLRLAVVYFTIGRSLPSWPATLKDDCLKSELLMGTAPASLSFDPAQWAQFKWSEVR